MVKLLCFKTSSNYFVHALILTRASKPYVKAYSLGLFVHLYLPLESRVCRSGLGSGPRRLDLNTAAPSEGNNNIWRVYVLWSFTTLPFTRDQTDHIIIYIYYHHRV